jgi:GntR family transcriptional regulator/MocR family aminotransferase
VFVKVGDAGALYEQVYESLRAAILEGRLAPGSRLPSTRTLASDIGVSRTTVLLAYDQLLAEGYTSSRTGSGTYVAPQLPDPLPTATHTGPRAPAAAPRRLSAYGERVREDLGGTRIVPWRRRATLRYDFRYGLPAVEEFPHQAWRRLLARRARAASLRSLQYGSPEGYGPLREAIAGYLGRARAVACGPEQVIIVNGSQQALDLTARLLLDPGDVVVIEEPQYQGARKVFLAAGARLAAVPVDDEGLDITTLPTSGPAPKLAYVTPSHQFPTGAVMSLTRRLALLAWAVATEAYVLEDDYDSEFRYEGRPIEAVQGLDRAGRVIYAGTFSKVMFPALRIGYLVLPEQLIAPFVAAKWLSDRHTPTLEQETLADFIGEGQFERHLRRSRTRNAALRAALLEALRECFGDRVAISGENAGVHLLVWLLDTPPGDVGALVERAERAGVGIYSVAPYYAGSPPRAGLLLGYASMTERAIRAGIRKLAEAIGDTIGSQRGRNG